MKSIDTLAAYFQTFPGIGPRQAKRFVFFLLRQNPTVLKDMARLIEGLRRSIGECTQCHRFYETTNAGSRCDICASPNRDNAMLMIVEKDVDLDAIEKSGVYDGLYFVLGGTVPLMESPSDTRLRLDTLEASVRTAEHLTEIIIATGAHPEGEATADAVRSLLAPLAEQKHFSLTLLGRGLSTGNELEYSDRDTIRNALQNRR